MVKFKELVEETSKELKIIEKFLNIKKSKFTSVEIKKQKGNRENNDLLQKIKRDKILRNISDKYKMKLIELEKLHKKK